MALDGLLSSSLTCQLKGISHEKMSLFPLAVSPSVRGKGGKKQTLHKLLSLGTDTIGGITVASRPVTTSSRPASSGHSSRWLDQVTVQKTAPSTSFPRFGRVIFARPIS